MSLTDDQIKDLYHTAVMSGMSNKDAYDLVQKKVVRAVQVATPYDVSNMSGFLGETGRQLADITRSTVGDTAASTLESLIGSGIIKPIEGIRQIANSFDPEEQAQLEQNYAAREKILRERTGGGTPHMVGDVAGSFMPAMAAVKAGSKLPLAVAPAKTALGRVVQGVGAGAAAGGAEGFIAPTAPGESRTSNTLFGTTIGGLGGGLFPAGASTQALFRDLPEEELAKISKELRGDFAGNATDALEHGASALTRKYPNTPFNERLGTTLSGMGHTQDNYLQSLNKVREGVQKKYTELKSKYDDLYLKEETKIGNVSAKDIRGAFTNPNELTEFVKSVSAPKVAKIIAPLKEAEGKLSFRDIREAQRELKQLGAYDVANRLDDALNRWAAPYKNRTALLNNVRQVDKDYGKEVAPFVNKTDLGKFFDRGKFPSGGEGKLLTHGQSAQDLLDRIPELTPDLKAMYLSTISKAGTPAATEKVLSRTAGETLLSAPERATIRGTMQDLPNPIYSGDLPQDWANKLFLNDVGGPNIRKAATEVPEVLPPLRALAADKVTTAAKSMDTAKTLQSPAIKELATPELQARMDALAKVLGGAENKEYAGKLAGIVSAMGIDNVERAMRGVVGSKEWRSKVLSDSLRGYGLSQVYNSSTEGE